LRIIKLKVCVRVEEEQVTLDVPGRDVFSFDVTSEFTDLCYAAESCRL